MSDCLTKGAVYRKNMAKDWAGKMELKIGQAQEQLTEKALLCGFCLGQSKKSPQLDSASSKSKPMLAGLVSGLNR